jgi:hypothetical protein
MINYCKERKRGNTTMGHFFKMVLLLQAAVSYAFLQSSHQHRTSVAPFTRQRTASLGARRGDLFDEDDDYFGGSDDGYREGSRRRSGGGGGGGGGRSSRPGEAVGGGGLSTLLPRTVTTSLLVSEGSGPCEKWLDASQRERDWREQPTQPNPTHRQTDPKTTIPAT